MAPADCMVFEDLAAGIRGARDGGFQTTGILDDCSKEEWENLLASPAVHTSNWIADENKRKQSYRELAGSGCRETLLQTIYSIYAHRTAQKALGKRLHMCDENFLHDAEKMLSSEIEAVLGLSAPEALDYLRTSLSA